jgi:hypothetical protein
MWKVYPNESTASLSVVIYTVAFMDTEHRDALGAGDVAWAAVAAVHRTEVFGDNLQLEL